VWMFVQGMGEGRLVSMPQPQQAGVQAGRTSPAGRSGTGDASRSRSALRRHKGNSKPAGAAGRNLVAVLRRQSFTICARPRSRWSVRPSARPT